MTIRSNALLVLKRALAISISNSGQNFEIRVSGSWEKKPGNIRCFRVLKWMRFWAIKNSISLWNYHCWALRNLLVK